MNIEVFIKMALMFVYDSFLLAHQLFMELRRIYFTKQLKDFRLLFVMHQMNEAQLVPYIILFFPNELRKEQ